MAVLSRTKNWIAERLNFADLNAEFNVLFNAQQDIGWPRDGTVATDFDGNELILDGDQDTSITADTDDQIDIRVGGVDVMKITGSVFTYLGSPVITRQTLARLGLSGVAPKLADIERRVLNREHTAILESRVFS